MDKESKDPFDRRAVSGGQYATSKEDFHIQTQKGAVKFLHEGIQPPGALYIGLDDSIQVWLSSGLLTSGVNVNGRFLRAADGVVVPFQQQFNVVAAGRSPLNFSFKMGEGFLLSLALLAAGTATSEASIFGWVGLQRAGQINAAQFQLLCSGYAGGVKGPFWPGGQNVRSLEGPGYIRSIVGTTPALGAEIQETVPLFARWELLAFQGALTTSAVVANREPWFIIDDGVNLLKRAFSNAVQPASGTTTYYADNPGFLPTPTNLAALWPTILPIYLGPGFRIRTATSALDPGDQWTSPKYLVREWIDAD